MSDQRETSGDVPAEALSDEELDAQRAEALPDREAMSIITPPGSIGSPAVAGGVQPGAPGDATGVAGGVQPGTPDAPTVA
jgi:hypothetical protein